MKLLSEPVAARLGGSTRRVADRWQPLLFGSGLVVLAFILGMTVAITGVFPSSVMRAAIEASLDWRENWRHYLRIRSKHALVSDRRAGGVTIYDPQAAHPGHTFITAYRDGHFHAFLIDMQGTVEHEWGVAYSEVWPDPRHLAAAPPDFDVSIHGAVLLPDGGVALNFDGVGTVRLDRCSRVLWNIPAQTHHAIDPLPDGGFLVPARRKLARPNPDLPRILTGRNGWVREDTILRVSREGVVVEEFSLLQVLLASGMEALLYANARNNVNLQHTNDPLHLNDVEVLREEMAAAFPLFAPGDVMVSLRNLNTIAVLDGGTRRIKWSVTGPFLRQHDPDFLPNGHILVFDNRKGGRAREFGFSRVLEIDPTTRQVVWSYSGSEREPFYTSLRGKQQSLPNGNVLVTEPEGGRVFEISRAEDGRLVWEWVNEVGEGLVGTITQADRVATDQVAFIGQPCG